MARGADNALQSLQRTTALVQGLNIDTIFDHIDKIRKARDDKLKADQEFNQKVADLDLKAQWYGIGRAYGDPRTGKVGITTYPQGQAPNVSPAAQAAGAYGAASQGLPIPTAQSAPAQRPLIDPAVAEAIANLPLNQRAQAQKQITVSAATQRIKDTQDQIAKQSEAQRNTEYSEKAISSAAATLATGWARAYREGYVGDAYRDTAQKVLSSGVFGSKAADKAKEASAQPGLKTEVINRLMPIFTQQGDKAGSVRLVQSVWQRLGETLPKGYSGPGAARRQLETTMQNMERYARAYYQTGKTAAEVDQMDPQQFNEYVNHLASLSDTIDLSPDEQKQISRLTSKALKPINDILIEERKSGKRAGFDLNLYKDEYNTYRQMGYSHDDTLAVLGITPQQWNTGITKLRRSNAKQ